MQRTIKPAPIKHVLARFVAAYTALIYHPDAPTDLIEPLQDAITDFTNERNASSFPDVEKLTFKMAIKDVLDDLESTEVTEN